ncbi:MAG: glycoside hydrolase family 99-like domain-containing protein [Candidatus Nanopelagicales bacterium]|nr:glycoside hydrolase family 99-like domain-containing protein [Candidatus Nanopelagicales bacterium]
MPEHAQRITAHQTTALNAADGTAAPHDIASTASSLEIDGLLAENQRQRQRIADLELTVVEYRKQMSQVLTSTSWRVTSPLRVFAAGVRIARLRARRWVARRRRRRSAAATLRLSGLFAPAAHLLPETSPLRRAGADRRPAPPARRPRDANTVLPRIVVVAHVHYPELWADIEDRLARIHEPFDLIVTVTQGTAESAIPAISRRHVNARIELVPNRGRDWAPLIHVVNEGLLRGYTAVAKVHTKKSEHRLDGDTWRLELLDGILESPDAIKRTVDLLDADRTVGIVLPTGHVSGPDHWGSNQGIVELLASRLPMAFDPDELAFPAGSMFWCRPWLLEQLAELGLDENDFEVEGGQYDGTTAHALERMVGVMSTVGGMDLVETLDVPSRTRELQRHPPAPAKLLAFYLPQYYANADNDEFWGEGFTDWHNVRRALPLYAGHRQPITPPEHVGYYDLADGEELRRQADDVRAMGIDALVFYHYWFDGRRALRTPLDNLLADPSIPLPFALCWANEPWTRRWDGLDMDVLISQTYTQGWEHRFYDDIRPALFDPRYVTVDEKPLLLVYRLDLLPDLKAALAIWRHLAEEDGLEGLHILGVLPSRDFGDVDPSALDQLDGLISFPPGSGVSLTSIVDCVPGGVAGLTGDVYSYDTAADSPALAAPEGVHVPVYPTVFPGWDNTARRGIDAYVFHGSNPVTFRRWLQRATRYNPEHDPNLVFINAWNEWAEGAHLEGGELPDIFPSSYRAFRGH